MPPKRPPPNLLLCFDAFGTFFKPKRPVEEQYASVAHRFGLGLNPDGTGTTDFGAAEVRSSFRTAFKAAARSYPNYGRAVGMGPTAWWTEVITNTFTPLLPPHQQSQPLPEGLAPALIHRFSSAEGYMEPSPGLKTLFRRLKGINTCDSPTSPFSKIVIGVITNSDDRVPDILSSFGLRVGGRRFREAPPSSDMANVQISAVDHPTTDATTSGTTSSLTQANITGREQEPPSDGKASIDDRMRHEEEEDINFTCLSYDVGHEKPDRRIFEAAEGMCRQVLLASSTDAPPLLSPSKFESEFEPEPVGQGLISEECGEEWLRIYVGDEYKADVEGALGAGWNAIWIPEMGHAHLEFNGATGNGYDNGKIVARPEGRYNAENGGKAVGFVDLDQASVEGVKFWDVFRIQREDGKRSKMIKCSSLEVLIGWLVSCSSQAT